MKKLIYFSVLSFMLYSCISAQKIYDENVSVKYTRLPLTPLNTSERVFYAKANIAYEEAIKQQQQLEAQQHNKAMAEWKIQCNKIESEYQAAWKVYQSYIEKGKYMDPPTKQPCPPEPVATQTYIARVYTPAEITTRLEIDGFNKTLAPDSNIKVEVILLGFQYNKPTLKITEKSIKQKDGSVTKVPYYQYEIQNKHPMSLKVIGVDNTIVYEDNLTEFNAFKTATTDLFESQAALDVYWNANQNKFLSDLDQTITNQNLTTINIMLNDKFGYSPRTYNVDVFSVKEKKHGYDDFERAFIAAKDGYRRLNSGDDTYKESLNKAVKEWETALQQADVENRKARVNANVASVAYLNLAEAYMWMGEYNKAYTALDQVNLIGKGKYEREASAIKSFMEDYKKRQEANQ